MAGLDNAGDAWHSLSPAAVFKDHTSEHHGLFDDRLSNHKFTLNQVAVFATTLETLVHSESLERLEAAYRVFGLSWSESVSKINATDAIHAYMLMYVSGQKTRLL